MDCRERRADRSRAAMLLSLLLSLVFGTTALEANPGNSSAAVERLAVHKASIVPTQRVSRAMQQDDGVPDLPSPAFAVPPICTKFTVRPHSSIAIFVDAPCVRHRASSYLARAPPAA